MAAVVVQRVKGGRWRASVQQRMKKGSAVMEDVELENDKDIMKGERDKKSIVAAFRAVHCSQEEWL